MPLFALLPDGIRPFRRLNSATDLYEREIETLLWDNLEAISGEPLFPVARQPRLRGGGIPDVIALDAQGRVVVIEIKRDVDRSQLAQILEYAGWARNTNLDELAGLYSPGAERFFTDWQEFTGTTTPMLLDRSPRVVMVARSFDGRTNDALQFLLDAGVPLGLIRVVFYEDARGDRIVDVDMSGTGTSTPPPTLTPAQPSATLDRVRPAKTRPVVNVSLADLLDAGVIHPDEALVWLRPQAGQEHRATVRANGEVAVADGRTFTSLSTAADSLAGGSFNGWECWAVPRLGNVKIGQLRTQMLRTDS